MSSRTLTLVLPRLQIPEPEPEPVQEGLSAEELTEMLEKANAEVRGSLVACWRYVT